MSIEKRIIEREDVNNQLDHIREGVGGVYASMNNSFFIDTQIVGVDMEAVNRYIGNMGKVHTGQDLIYGRLAISSLPLDETSYEELCYYLDITPSDTFSGVDHQIHFVEIHKKNKKYVMTVIPIQYNENTINIRIEKLNKPEAEYVREIHKGASKLKIEDIKFVKFPQS
ncbi:hypothetical protein GX888_03105 [Candidatus Dojkabacteria bacterium]|uniref:Uncharacterized protein n=1 Tax=Candidatus Dojkabacteria bacterium TaxID=2099670 RepID=A0A847VDT5_9BACT|nr:hypothetical protein [Candidatus Dojkabacteria bacterium]